MVRRMLSSSITVLLLLVSTSLVSSKKSPTSLTKNAEDTSLEELSTDTIQLEPSESKSRYKWRQGAEGRYILEEDSDGKDNGGHLKKDEDYDDHTIEYKNNNKKAKISKIESLKPKLKTPKVLHTEKRYVPKKDNNGQFKEGHDKDKEFAEEDQEYHKESKKTEIEPSESIWKSSRKSYKGRHSDGHYNLNEDDHGHGKGGHGGKDEEFIEEEGDEEHNEEEHDRGYHNEDKKLDDETVKEFSIKGTDQAFKEGGASFDKHHKDRASENKENEHINEHDEGEKFGAEALKEHKLGKHREKSIGHKKHGFKNVYHKEEYGDHKTFHDEFLDNDHHHEYDDAHENRKLEGGRFSKGYLKEGENKELDAGDEKHAWGKGGHDSQHDAHYEEGGHITGHKQGHRKREGHHEASGRKHKQAKHKVKKGEVPVHSHYDEDEPGYYARSQKPHGGKERNLKVHLPDNAGGGHHYSYDPESYDTGDKQKGPLYPPVVRTHGRLPESEEDLQEPVRHSLPEPARVVDHGRTSQPLASPEHHSFYYRKPQSENYEQVPLKNEKHIKVPHVPEVVQHNPWVPQHSPQIPHNTHYRDTGAFPTGLNHPSSPSGLGYHQQNHEQHHQNHGHHQHHHGNNNHDYRNHPHQQFVVTQRSKEPEPHDYLQNHPHNSMVSKPYPWWKHSRKNGDSAQASSHHRYGHETAPQHHNIWVPQNKFRYSEPYEHVASRQHHGYARRPEYYNQHRPY